MSIVRVGLSETKKFAEGYEAIFGKKSAGKAAGARKAKAPARPKTRAAAAPKAKRGAAKRTRKAKK